MTQFRVTIEYVVEATSEEAAIAFVFGLSKVGESAHITGNKRVPNEVKA